jgi:assimilatory nitrate reductase catalytic subunit
VIAATRSTCPYCGVGCGVLARARKDGSAEIAGDPEHPANRGRLCVKGSALGETLGLQGRLLHPEIRGQRVSWDQALEHVAAGFRRIIDAHGPEAVALYVSGQLLTEDYYVANKLMKGYIGSANIDTNSRLCMSSAVAGHKRAFGEDLVPCTYADLEAADLVVLVGSNTAWCHPILYQRLMAARAARPERKLVVIDPRRTASCDGADLHLPIRPGTDVWLFNGLLQYLAKRGHSDRAFVDRQTEGLDAALDASAAQASVEAVATACGLAPDRLQQFYALFAATSRTVTAFSQGVNQSTAGSDKVNAIINCHLLTGRIGRRGAGPFSLTGQPNAMGGREVGGLANQLAAHLELEDPAHRQLVQTFWNSPVIADHAGLKAVELFEAIGDGRVRAVWIMGTNPVVSLPDADAARRALQRCELVVCSDILRDTDTNACASVLLPALGWGEKDGTVTNSERCISRQRAFLPPPGEARADWWAICGVARRMGYAEGFDFDSAAAIFDEHARLSGYRNAAPGGTAMTEPRLGGPGPALRDREAGTATIPRVLDLSGYAGLSAAQYAAMPPRRWPLRAPLEEEQSDTEPDFILPHARFVATPVRGPAHAPSAAYPLRLNTGRLRDQWHTMTRTGRSARLSAHIDQPLLTLHPADARQQGLDEGTLARLRSPWGSAVLRVRIGEEQTPGDVFAPIHWNDTNASAARVGAVVNPAVDPLSGEPEFKHTPVQVQPFAARWYGFALLRQAPPRPPAADWWVQITGSAHTRLELAGCEALTAPGDWVRALAPGFEGHWIEARDPQRGGYRAAALVDGQLQAAVFIAPTPHLPSPLWLASRFAETPLTAADRRALLAGRPARPGADHGPVVCSCFGVGQHQITEAIRLHALCSAAAIGAHLKAGTHCGSCVPELNALLAAARPVSTT